MPPLHWPGYRIAQAGSRSSSSASSHERAVALINDLCGAGTALLLVLDDYHAIREFAVHDLVTFLLANQPPGVHLVIGTREDPPLPVARMRALNQVTEIRERSLRFTLEEASLFFDQTMHLGLSPASVATLTARTKGWIAGPQLAGPALSQARSMDEFVAAFAGDDQSPGSRPTGCRTWQPARPISLLKHRPVPPHAGSGVKLSTPVLRATAGSWLSP